MVNISENNMLIYSNQQLMQTLKNLLNRSGYNQSLKNNNSNENLLDNTDLSDSDENVGILPDYEFMALNILSILKKGK